MAANENSRTYRVARLAAQLAQEIGATSPHRCATDAMALHRIAATAERLAVLRCNGIQRYVPGRGLESQWTEEDEAHSERQTDLARTKAEKILSPYGASVLTITGDPRGCVVRLQLASKATNGFGEGWGL
jgi:hypothetical protein